MKILVVCDQGNNRSVTLAHQLKYLNHDVLTAGIKTNSPDTLKLLANWSDLIIITEENQQVPALENTSPISLWNIGPDIYPRPFNRELLAKVRKLVEIHRSMLEKA